MRRPVNESPGRIIERSALSLPLLVPLASCSDRALAGGKAVGLAQLLNKGFQVPPGLCLTTRAYRDTLHAGGLDPVAQWKRIRKQPGNQQEYLLGRYRRAVTSLVLPRAMLDLIDTELACLGKSDAVEEGLNGGRLWAVRSSASDEDAPDRTFGGIYRTVLGVPRLAVAAAILDCWASLWTAAAIAYRGRTTKAWTVPAMAVILQPLLAARAAGVAYSRHPISGRADHVMINAVFGLGEPLVSGRTRPDLYVVQTGNEFASMKLIQRDIAEKTTSSIAMPWGLVDQPLPAQGRSRAVLEEEDVLALATLVKKVECAIGMPVDVEWALTPKGISLLQARPIPAQKESDGFTTTVWSRANFKETLPELPSPLGLSCLTGFMEAYIVRPYRELGCRIPPGASSVKIIHGRPFINVTLFQSVMAQLGGDPALLAEQMGGDRHSVAGGGRRLSWWRIVLLMEWKIRRAARRAPAWFQEMRLMGARCQDETARGITPHEWPAWEKELSRSLLRGGDFTFALFSGVSQGLYLMNVLLERRLRSAWRPLLNQALQGVGTIISAKQILWLAELAEVARGEPAVQKFLLAKPWLPQEFRTALAGSRFLQVFDDYLAEYGHRAAGESDVMSPRFAEVPDYVLGVIRVHLSLPSVRSTAGIRQAQESTKQEALRGLRAGFGWRLHEWALWIWCYRRLCRHLELREANRHALMQVTACARQVAMSIGGSLAAGGILQSGDDIFFLTIDEVRTAVSGAAGDWQKLVAARRRDREQNTAQSVSDTVIEHAGEVQSDRAGSHAYNGPLKGLPISVGYVVGPIRLVLSPNDMKQVKRGDIVVAPVLDPGMAPLMGLAAGLIVEMGGTLSHGAIIAREYGLPTIANVRDVTQLLKSGERVAMNATAGEITRLAM